MLKNYCFKLLAMLRKKEKASFKCEWQLDRYEIGRMPEFIKLICFNSGTTQNNEIVYMKKLSNII